MMKTVLFGSLSLGALVFCLGLAGCGGGTLTLSCGASDRLTQPLTVDGQGDFDVLATVHPSLPVSPIFGGTLPRVHLVGTVHEGTMTISEKAEVGQGTVYTLTYGQVPPPFGGACPV